MEALGGYPTRSSNPKAKKLTVLLSMTVGVGCLFLLQTQLLKPGKPVDFYTFEVKDAKGRTVLLEKYRGKVGPHHRRIKRTFHRARKIGKVDHVLPQFKKKVVLESCQYFVFHTTVICEPAAPLVSLFAGVSGCKRGESQRADREQLQSSAGAAPGTGTVALQRPGLPLRPVRGHGNHEQSGNRGVRQVHLRRHIPLLQQDQDPGLRGRASLQVPHRSAAATSVERHFTMVSILDPLTVAFVVQDTKNTSISDLRTFTNSNFTSSQSVGLFLLDLISNNKPWNNCPLKTFDSLFAFS